MNGFILLPDDWSASVYALNYTNRSDAPYTTNEISVGSWATMESAGAVFLPAAGDRHGTSDPNLGPFGDYWSSSPSPFYPSSAWTFYFFSGYAGMNDPGRSGGFSVRLVREN
ncbi:MAG: DUF1566 domain-containing protein [Bacteroidales bacterium]|nr:DUF1566 domain-containing protein [Bacteroidales bacterium]